MEYPTILGLINNSTFWTALAALASLATAIVTAIYTFFTGKMVKGELGPKLHLKADAIDTGDTYDKLVNDDIGFPYEHQKIGFVSDSAKKKLTIDLVNNGNSPATHIVFKYTIVLYKHHVEFEEGGRLIDVNTANLVEYKKVNRTFTVDYLPPNDKIGIEVMFVDLFPYVKLQANSLSSDEQKFISKDTIIFNYRHPAFEVIVDSHDMRMNLGLRWIKQKEDTEVSADPKV